MPAKKTNLLKYLLYAFILLGFTGAIITLAIFGLWIPLIITAVAAAISIGLIAYLGYKNAPYSKEAACRYMSLINQQFGEPITEVFKDMRFGFVLVLKQGNFGKVLEPIDQLETFTSIFGNIV